jgi:hypothetical protein
MKTDKLTKILSLLVKLDLGVGLDIQPPFLTGKVNDRAYTILCKEVSHKDGTISKVKSPVVPTNIFLYIKNKQGNNIILLSTKASNKLLQRDVTMRELAQGIFYKNEMELYENNTSS